MNDRADIYIFLSYTTREEEVRQVRPFVKEIVARLRARGYGECIDPLVWWDADRIGPLNIDLRTVLAEAIARCRHLLAFVSPSYWQSCWCRFEWEQAFQHHVRDPRRRLVPILWKGEPDISLWEPVPPWRSLGYVDASHPYGWWNTPSQLPEDMPRIVNEVLRGLGEPPIY